jgi:ABC-type multidrug transport system ATPase subunit
VATLSGGERARLLFIGLSLAQYELILLDEPTNHLDLEGKEDLSEEISQFSGALLVVSHDRWLIENSCQRFWFIDEHQLVEYLNIEDIYHKIEQQAQLLPHNHPDDVEYSNAVNVHPKVISHEDELLENLLVLEEKLHADKQRKLSHQKPQLQQQWIDEIAQIQAQLGL